MTAMLEQIRDSWDAIATGYDAHVTPTHMWLANEGLKRAGVGRGTYFLDVACGSGALSIPAARLGARVLATDLSPRMLERLRERARREGLAGQIECRAMDGHSLDLEDDSFDVAGSQFGVMVFPDMPRGIAEMAQVTKPGGRVLVHAYGPPERVEFFSLFAAAMEAAVPGFSVPADPPPLPFQLRDPETLRRELARASLSDIQVETTTERLEFRSTDEMWNWLVNSNPVAEALLADLGDEHSPRVRDALDDLLRQRFGERGAATLNCEVHIGIGTK